jgi:hypothetical protein
MKNTLRHLFPLACLTLPLFGLPAQAEEAKTVDITGYLCKDVMRMDTEERAVSLGVLHGYVLGRKNTTSFDDAKAAKLSTDFIEYCLDNPREQALASFEKLAK